MSESPEMRRFRSSEELMAYLRETSDDMVSVTIPVQPKVDIIDPQGKRERVVRDVGAIIATSSGRSLLFHREDMQMLLNDGLLVRMKIPCILSTIDGS